MPQRGNPCELVWVAGQRASASKMATGPPSSAIAVSPVSLPVVCASPGAQCAACPAVTAMRLPSLPATQPDPATMSSTWCEPAGHRCLCLDGSERRRHRRARALRHLCRTNRRAHRSGRRRLRSDHLRTIQLRRGPTAGCHGTCAAPLNGAVSQAKPPGREVRLPCRRSCSAARSRRTSATS